MAASLLHDFIKLKKLWPYLRSQKRLIVTAALLIPVISALQVSFPLVLKRTIDRGIVAGDLGALATGALAYLMIVLGEYLVRAGQSVCSALAVHRMIRDLRMRLVSHVLALKCSFHDRSMSGALVTRATGDFDNLSESLNMGVLTSVVDVAVLIGCVAGMLALDWRLALLALLILPLVWMIVQWFSKALKASMLRARVEIAALNGFTQEAFYGNATIKLLTAEPAATKIYDGLNERYRKAQMGSVILDAMMFSVLDGIASVTVGLVLWLAVSRVGISSGDALTQGLTAGLLVAFVQYVQQLFEPLKQLGNKIAMLQGAFTAIERIFGLLDDHQLVGGSEPTPPLRGEVVFDEVVYAYDTGDGKTASPALRGVSFRLPAGSSLAIVGPTGSGKSTIIKLLTKLYDGYRGRITLDGKDLACLEPVSLRQRIAVVPQDIVLFDGDLAFNITLGDQAVTRDKVLSTLVELGAEDFLRSLPKGLDSEIKEQGANLSHGQRQLIAFARALVKDPGLVILDEATSSVDPVSEAQLQRATQKLLQGRSVVVIAHRLSTIRQCDQILVLEAGKVVELGGHSKLLEAKGAYHRLHEAFAN
jgi:ATP-binding cassette subfamily B protein